MFGWLAPKPSDPLAGVSDFRRKSLELLVAMPPETHHAVKAACDWLAEYRQRKKPRPGSIDQVVFDRRHAEAVRLVESSGIDQAQAVDMVNLLVDGAS